MAKKRIGGKSSESSPGLKADAANGDDTKKKDTRHKGSSAKQQEAARSKTNTYTYLFLIGLSVVIATGAIIYSNEDVQIYLVKFTQLGSNPLQYIADSWRESSVKSKQADNTVERKPDSGVKDLKKEGSSKDTRDTVVKDKVEKKDKKDSEEDSKSNSEVKSKAKTDEKSVKENKDKVKSSSGDEGKEKQARDKSESKKVEPDKDKHDARESKNEKTDGEVKQTVDKSESKKVEPEKDKRDARGSKNEKTEAAKEGTQNDQEIRANKDSVSKNEDDATKDTDKSIESKQKSEETVQAQDIKKDRQKEEVYEKRSITTDFEMKYRGKLDAADAVFEQGMYQDAMKRYELILGKLPNSPRALFGKGRTLNALAEQQRSNKLLEECIEVLGKVLQLKDVPEALVPDVAELLANRASFRGFKQKEVNAWKYAVERFPDNVKFQRNLGIAYLKQGYNVPAEKVFQKLLKSHPDDYVGLSHIGFIEKNERQNYTAAIDFLERGFAAEGSDTLDGKFYYHLGDSYVRVNQSEKAMEVYKKAVDKGLFNSLYQRSLYNADTPLTARPWWTKEQTTYKRYMDVLEENWKVIRDEGLKLLNQKTNNFFDEDEDLREKGEWQQFVFYRRGKVVPGNCEKAPKTCDLLSNIPDATTNKRGQIKFSVMHGGVHVWPHTGPTNCRIRAHLGLVIPKGPRIRVAEDTRTWVEGKFIIFDDSFEHEVWHDGTETRLVLIIDFWHPDLTQYQRDVMSPI